jgi:hypothetical protein
MPDSIQSIMMIATLLMLIVSAYNLTVGRRTIRDMELEIDREVEFQQYRKDFFERLDQRHYETIIKSEERHIETLKILTSYANKPVTSQKADEEPRP